MSSLSKQIFFFVQTVSIDEKFSSFFKYLNIPFSKKELTVKNRELFQDNIYDILFVYFSNYKEFPSPENDYILTIESENNEFILWEISDKLKNIYSPFNNFRICNNFDEQGKFSPEKAISAINLALDHNHVLFLAFYDLEMFKWLEKNICKL